MSLETLLEAARYVEQQEQRAKLQSQLPCLPAPSHVLQNNNNTAASITSLGLKIIAHPQQQLTQSPPAALLATHGPHIQGVVSGELVVVGQKDVQPVVKLVSEQLPLLNTLDKTILIPAKRQHVSPNTTSTANSNNTSPAAINTAAQQQNSSTSPGVLRSGTREVHNKLEKNRRAHLKECFELLKKQLPPQQDEKKSSNLSILHSALRHIQALKKRERENEHEMERLAREKIAAQQRLAALKKELGTQWDNIDFNCLLPAENGTNIHQTITGPTLLSTLKDEPQHRGGCVSSAQLSVLPPPTVSYAPIGQGLVVGLHKVLVGKGVQMVQNPVIIAPPINTNGKIVPLVNAQYLVKPMVVVSSPSAGGAALSPRQS